MHLAEYKFFPSVVKLLYPLKIKLNPIQNFIKSLVNTSNRKQKPLDQVSFLLWLSQFCPDYFNEKYGLIKSTWIFLKNSIFKVSTPQALTKSLKASKTDASCCIYFICLHSKMEWLVLKKQIQKLLWSFWGRYADCETLNSF